MKYVGNIYLRIKFIWLLISYKPSLGGVQVLMKYIGNNHISIFKSHFILSFILEDPIFGPNDGLKKIHAPILIGPINV